MPQRALSQVGPWASACAVASRAVGLGMRCRLSGRGPRHALSQLGPWASACAVASRAVGLGLHCRISGCRPRHALSQLGLWASACAVASRAVGLGMHCRIKGVLYSMRDPHVQAQRPRNTMAWNPSVLPNHKHTITCCPTLMGCPCQRASSTTETTLPTPAQTKTLSPAPPAP